MNPNAKRAIRLDEPARYLPFASGRYRVAADLNPMDRDFGNGPQDGKVFQLDRECARYRANVDAVRREHLSRYAGEKNCPPMVMRAVAGYMARQVAIEYPPFFALNEMGAGYVLECVLTDESLQFDENFDFVPNGSQYRNSIDALASQVQEDLAIVHAPAESHDRVVSVHVAAPSFWDPPSKLDLHFADVHEPVPAMEKLNRQAPKIVQMLTGNVTYQRFGWSVTTDRRLNHHETAPASFEGTAEEWRGTRFDRKEPRLYVRIERQVLVGFPEVSAFLFLIRPHFVDAHTLSAEERAKLADAIESMSPETRRYKNVAHHAEAIIAWLRMV